MNLIAVLIGHKFEKDVKMIAEEVVLDCKNVDTFYGDFYAIKNVSLKFYKNKVTAIIGPSDCGKTTLLKSFNRMNDFVDEFFIEGNIDLEIETSLIFHNGNKDKNRMVFQRPNPFPKSICKYCLGLRFII